MLSYCLLLAVASHILHFSGTFKHFSEYTVSKSHQRAGKAPAFEHFPQETAPDYRRIHPESGRKYPPLNTLLVKPTDYFLHFQSRKLTVSFMFLKNYSVVLKLMGRTGKDMDNTKPIFKYLDILIILVIPFASLRHKQGMKKLVVPPLHLFYNNDMDSNTLQSTER